MRPVSDQTPIIPALKTGSNPTLVLHTHGHPPWEELYEVKTLSVKPLIHLFLDHSRLSIVSYCVYSVSKTSFGNNPAYIPAYCPIQHTCLPNRRMQCHNIDLN